MSPTELVWISIGTILLGILFFFLTYHSFKIDKCYLEDLKRQLEVRQTDKQHAPKYNEPSRNPRRLPISEEELFEEYVKFNNLNLNIPFGKFFTSKHHLVDEWPELFYETDNTKALMIALDEKK